MSLNQIFNKIRKRKCSRIDVLKVLVQIKDISYNNYIHKKILQIACQAENIKIVRLILDRGKYTYDSELLVIAGNH